MSIFQIATIRYDLPIINWALISWPGGSQLALLLPRIFFLQPKSLQILPRSLGPFCSLLFHMMTQNIIKFDGLEYLAATCCRFVTLLIQKVY